MREGVADCKRRLGCIDKAGPRPEKQPILHHDRATPFPPPSPCDMLMSRRGGGAASEDRPLARLTWAAGRRNGILGGWGFGDQI
jgi:hypothetical protein